MPDNVDNQFYNRADAHILLSNQQSPLFGVKPTTYSMIYGTARFAAWCATSAAGSRAELEAAKTAEIENYTSMFKAMLEESMQYHLDHFEELKGLKR